MNSKPELKRWARELIIRLDREQVPPEEVSLFLKDFIEDATTKKEQMRLDVLNRVKAYCMFTDLSTDQEPAESFRTAAHRYHEDLQYREPLNKYEEELKPIDAEDAYNQLLKTQKISGLDLPDFYFK